jgi:hypothetical protein
LKGTIESRQLNVLPFTEKKSREVGNSIERFEIDWKFENEARLHVCIHKEKNKPSG